MKQILLLLAVLLFALTGCQQDVSSSDSSSIPPADTSDSASVLADYPPAVMVDGQLYIDTGNIFPADSYPTCGTLDGEFTSYVPQSELPGENLQSNFTGAVGYQNYSEDTILVQIKGDTLQPWVLFSLEDGAAVSGSESPSA